MIDYITREIAAVCPIHGVSSDGAIFFKDEATGDQQAAATVRYAEITSPDGIAAYEAFAQRESIKAQILAIEEREIMPRKTREIQIQVMLFFAQQQGLTHDQLYAVNPAYKGMVDVDNQIKVLRAQL
jgi:hypothetical protein